MNTVLPPSRLLSAAIRTAALAVGLTLPLSALAELTNDSLLGPGLRSRPAYDGSSSQRTEFVPVIRYLGQPWFARSTQGVLEAGARFELAPGLHVGPQLAYESGRKPSESNFLQSHNIAGINHGASVGAQIEWDHKFGPMPITLLGRVRQNTDSDRGAQADLRFSAGVFQKGPVALGLFTQATWANAKATRSMYGLTPQQSVGTGLPAYAAGSGLMYASFGLLYGIDLAKNWVVVGSIEGRHLQGDAEKSPLAERTWNHYLSTGLAYKF